MPRSLRLLAALGAITLLLASPTRAGAGAADDSRYVAATVAAWQDGDPVYVSPDSGALSASAADSLRDRITGWRDDVLVAVLPATAVRRGPGEDVDEASALIDDLYVAMGQQDGIYLVSFSGAGTYAAGYGDTPGADDVGAVVAREVGSHTLSQVDQILDGTLDGLGAPASGGGVPVARVVVGVLAAAVLASGATLLVVRRRRRPWTGATGESSAGAADYRPGFTVYGDEQDTVAKRAALAREDVTRLGEELDAADPPLDQPDVAAHVQAALDAYADASRRVDALTTDDELRTMGEVTEYARWQLACAEATLHATPPPPRRVPCFVDPAHGLSVADVSWAPPGGTLRPVPVCRSCYERLTEGHR